jgi:hypothetical protein
MYSSLLRKGSSNDLLALPAALQILQWGVIYV